MIPVPLIMSAGVHEELSALQVPQGTTPRSVSVQLRGELTRRVKPGDAVTLTGVFLPEPYTGYRAIKAGLITSTFIEAMNITHDKQSYTATSLTKEQIAEAHVRSRPCLQLIRPPASFIRWLHQCMPVFHYTAG